MDFIDTVLCTVLLIMGVCVLVLTVTMTYVVLNHFLHLGACA